MRIPKFKGFFSPLKATTIVLINGDQAELVALGDQLANAGYHSLLFDNPIDALEQIQWTLPDLVIVDFIMPSISAILFLKELNAIPNTPPCIVMSTINDESQIIAAFEAGAKDYIRKPLPFGELNVKLKRLLGLVEKSSIHSKAVTFFGDYRVIEEIGRGGMGVVYKVQSEKTGQFFALKTISEDQRSHNSMLRFRQEIQILKGLDHDNLLKLHASEQYRTTPYYIMDWVDGVTLEHYCLRNGALRSTKAAAIIYQLTCALCYLHSNKILHRDIKPANVMINDKNEVFLIDFGLAKFSRADRLTRRFSLMGTPHFTAPEVIRGSSADARSDLFSLGILALELLLGTNLIKADNAYTAMQTLLSGKFTRACQIQDVDGNFAHIIDRLVELDPNDRYQSAIELLLDLLALTGNPPLTVRQ